MGYELHIIRRGSGIAAEEWLGCVQRDPELRLHPENGPYFVQWNGSPGEGWLDWSEDASGVRAPVVSLRERVSAWIERLRLRRSPGTRHEPLPFAVGDIVRDPWGYEHTVVDPDAEHGLGLIRTRRLSDGTEHARAIIAHGFISTSKP